MNLFRKKKEIKSVDLQVPTEKEISPEKCPKNFTVNSVLAYMPTPQIRDVCWKDIENVEHWARRLINEIMVENYGKNYFNYTDDKGNRIIKKEIVRSLQKRIDSNPKRFPRMVDALFLENIIDILCNETLYNDHFKEALKYAYPCGKDDAKHHLIVIKDIRNKYTHSNVISIRDAERAICYCHDFIDGLRKYYQETGKEKDYNVPTFLKLTDSQGLTHYFSSENYLFGHGIRLRSGDIYRVEVEVDPTFDSNGYKIEWCYEWEPLKFKKIHNKTSIDVQITNQMVGRCLKIECYIISDKDWHKHGWYDDSFNYMITTILPPIEDNY